MNLPLHSPGEEKPVSPIPWLEGLQDNDRVSVKVDGKYFHAIVEFRNGGRNGQKVVFIRAPGIWVRTAAGLARDKAEVKLCRPAREADKLRYSAKGAPSEDRR